jgi:hypothetical protein
MSPAAFQWMSRLFSRLFRFPDFFEAFSTAFSKSYGSYGCPGFFFSLDMDVPAFPAFSFLWIWMSRLLPALDMDVPAFPVFGYGCPGFSPAFRLFRLLLRSLVGVLV